MTDTQMDAARRKIRGLLDQHGVVHLSSTLGITNQYIYKMLRTGFVPDGQAKNISHLFEVPLNILRPDLWD